MLTTSRSISIFSLHTVRWHDSYGMHCFSFPLGYSSLMNPSSLQYCKDFKNESRVGWQ